jgi:hypothetical protein
VKQEPCFGTAWAEGRTSVEKASEPLAPGEKLQFACRGLDASLLTDLHMILLGMTYKEVAPASESAQPSEITTGVKRISSAQPAPYHTAHFYQCSDEFRARMAELGGERINEIARNWLALRAPWVTEFVPESAERMEHRREIIENLAALARVAQKRGSRLLLRAEYRMTE